MQVRPLNIQVVFVYRGYPVRVKVTQAKMRVCVMGGWIGLSKV